MKAKKKKTPTIWFRCISMSKLLVCETIFDLLECRVSNSTKESTQQAAGSSSDQSILVPDRTNDSSEMINRVESPEIEYE